MKRTLIAAAVAASTSAFGATTNTVELKAGLVNYDDGMDETAGDNIDGAVNSFNLMRAEWKQAGDVSEGYTYKFTVNMNDATGLALENAVLNWTKGMHMVTVGKADLAFGGAEDAATADIEQMVKSDVMATVDGLEDHEGLFYTATTPYGAFKLGVSNQVDVAGLNYTADTEAFANHFQYNGSFMGGNLLPVIQYSTWTGSDASAVDALTYMSVGLTYNVAGASITAAQHTATVAPAADGADDVIPTSTFVGVEYTTGAFRPYLNYISDVDDAESDNKVTTTTMNIGLLHDCAENTSVQLDYQTSEADSDGAEATTMISVALNAVVK